MKKILLALLLSCSIASARQYAFDRDIRLTTNEYDNTACFVISNFTLKGALSNLPSQICFAISNETAGLYYPLTNNPAGYITTNDLPAGDTNIYYLASNPDGYITTNDIPSVSFSLGAGFIDGVIPTYVSGSQVSVTPGALTIQGTNFSVDAAVTVDLATLLGAPITGRDIIYIYTDTSSFIGGTPDFYGDLGEPIQSANGTGWYHPSTVADRYIGSVRADSAGNNVLAFGARPISGRVYEHFFTSVQADPELLDAEAVLLNLSGAAFDTWVAPNVGGALFSDMVPLGVTRVYSTFFIQDPTAASPARVNYVQVGSRATGVNPGVPFDGQYGVVKYGTPSAPPTLFDHIVDSFWVPTNPSGVRDIYMLSSVHGADFLLTITAWEVSR